jgi:hypothetical protein
VAIHAVECLIHEGFAAVGLHLQNTSGCSDHFSVAYIISPDWHVRHLPGFFKSSIATIILKVYEVDV